MCQLTRIYAYNKMGCVNWYFCKKSKCTKKIFSYREVEGALRDVAAGAENGKNPI
jgi:hypothetical protein